MLDKLNKNKLLTLLRGELPGRSAHLKMEPVMAKAFPLQEECREAAVLILIYPDNGEFRMVFIKRNEYRGPHSGQVSFPGGIKEESDADFAHTALRETEEETGVSLADIELLGSLSPFFIPVSNFCVYPYVGWMEKMPEFNPDRSEVQYLICPTLKSLSDPKNRKTGNFDRRGTSVETPYIDIDGEMIWGATAMMLNEFIELIGC